MRAAKGLVGRVRGLGGAFLGVVGAEFSALVEDLASSGRRLTRSLLLFAAGFAFAFWTLGLLVYLLIELLALKVPRWGAVGIVFGLFLITAVALMAVSVSRLRRIESPAATVNRRVQGHLAWWQQRVAGATSLPGTADDEDPYEDDEEYP
jgi:cytochrome c biogenesis protein CcdA